MLCLVLLSGFVCLITLVGGLRSGLGGVVCADLTAYEFAL